MVYEYRARPGEKNRTRDDLSHLPSPILSTYLSVVGGWAERATDPSVMDIAVSAHEHTRLHTSDKWMSA
jgi:hypothetical protein